MLSEITDIQYLKGVGEKRARLLKKLGIASVGALLSFYPRNYRYLTDIKEIYEGKTDETVCVKGRIITPVTEHYIRKNMTIYKFRVADNSGNMQVTLFNTKYTAQRLHQGSVYLFYGKITGSDFLREMSSPEIYEENNNSILPIYNLTAGITSKYLGTLVNNALNLCEVADPLPEEIVKQYALTDKRTALQNIHFPKSREALEVAQKRLIFEELFILQSGMRYFKSLRRGNTAITLKTDYTNEFLSALPFELTASQKAVIADCVADMQNTIPMNRLVQGDVGSGKTAVAAAVAFSAIKNGYQASLMAPTVILAEQHYATFSKFFENSGINVALLTSSTKAAAKRKLLEGVKKGEIDMLIGTHAVISDTVEFDKLGLVITDEQHRFGVEQRSALSKKGQSPHTLVMSATPIPRTLAMVVYGELDVSVITEYPKGRQKIESYSVSKDLRKRVYTFVKKHLDEGRQGYVICPLVEENDTERLSAEVWYEKLQKTFFKDYRLGLLHGKMKDSEKEKVMRAFSQGEIALLISTTVVEVGIDVPNATVMVIEDADCFGLSQLHQLRGRIGRGEHKSTCILVSQNEKTAEKDRLKIISAVSDGFKIAEEDLKLRGPGDFIGKRQHGLPELKIADLNSDYSVLRLTALAAEALSRQDERLEAEQNKPLKNEILRLFGSV